MRGGISALGAVAAIIVLVAVQAFAVNYLGRSNYLPEGSEHWTEDWLVHYFSRRLTEPQKDIVLVIVDAESLEKAGVPATVPVDRGWMANLVQAVSAQQPLAIGIDFYFASAIDPVKDEQLVSAIRDAKPPVVIAAVDNARLSTEGQRKYQQTFIQRVNRPAGHIYLSRSQEILSLGDRATRGVDHGPSANGYASLSSTIARLPPVMSIFGAPEIPDGIQRIDWLLAPEGGETFMGISAHELIAPADGAQIPPLKDKIVLIGPDFTGLDQHSVPFSLGSEHTVFPGVFIHAQALAQILEHRFFFSWSSAQQFLLLFGIGLAGAAAGHAFRETHVNIILGIAGTLLIIALSVPFFIARVPLPTALAILSWALSLSIAQRIEVRRNR